MQKILVGPDSFGKVTVGRFHRLIPASFGSSVAAFLIGVGSLVACQGSTEPPGIHAVPAALTIVSGEAQSAVVGHELAQPVVARVVDANGDPVSGQLVNFRVTAGGGSVFAGASISNADGLVSERWTLGLTPGESQQLEARAVNNVTGAPLVFATYTAIALPPPSRTMTAYTAEEAPGTVGSPVVPSPAVRVLNELNQPVPGVTVTFAVVSGGGSITGAVATTNASGIAAVGGWTLGTVPGRQRLTATSDGVVNSPLSIDAIAAPGPATTLAIVTQPSNTMNAAPIGRPPVVQLRDAYGNDVPTAGVAVNASIGSGPTGTLANATATTDAMGRATFSALTLTGAMGTRTLSFAGAGITPATSSPFTHVVFASVYAGKRSAHTCALTPAGAAYCWGRDDFSTIDGGSSGALGSGVARSSSIPVAVAGGLAFTSLSLGLGHTCGLTSAGDAYCWGRDNFGQLGQATVGRGTYSLVPVRVVGGNAFVAISAGEEHTCALTAAGAAYCWGRNTDGNSVNVGQLGTGTDIYNASTPQLVAGGQAFTQISAGAARTCALTSSGRAFCWGSAKTRRLGDPFVPANHVPIEVDDVGPFTSINMFALEACATGTTAVYCWSGSAADSPPHFVPSVDRAGVSFTRIENAGSVRCAAGADSKLYCWDNSATPPSAPTPVLGTTYPSFTAGAAMCGVREDGLAVCWGSNFWGQLGDGTTTTRPTPTPVAAP